MAFNGSGTFVRLYNWTNDAANGIDISASRFDAEDNDFASGLSLCLTRDGQGKPTAALAWTYPLSLSPSTNSTALTLNAYAANYAAILNGNSSASNSYGLKIVAGTNSSDSPLLIQNASASTLLQLLGSGALTVNGATTISTGGLTVTAGGIGVAAGGLTVSAGTTAVQALTATTMTASATGSSLAGAVTIAATSGQNSLTSTAPSGQYAGIFVGGGSAGTQAALSARTTTGNAADVLLNLQYQGSNNIANVYADGHFQLGYNGSGYVITTTAAGAVSIAAPSSGVALTLNRSGSGPVLEMANGSYTGTIYVDTSGNTYFASETAANNAFAPNAAANSLGFYSNGSSRGSINSSGLWSITAAASSTQALQVNGGAATPTVALSAGGAIALDASRGNVFTASVTSNATITISNMASGQTINVRTTTTGSYTVTFSPTPKWPNGTAGVATASGTDLWVITYDGTNYYASVLNALA